MGSRDYKDLIVWRKSMDLVDIIYNQTEHFPDKERYRLIDQMCRSAISIPSNIAEGSKRSGEKEFRHFLYIAYGSGAELETQIQIAKRRGYGEDWATADQLLSEVMKMLNTMCSTFSPSKNYQLQTTN